MSLTGRFSTAFLAALGIVLVGYSVAIYVAARVYLDRQVDDRLRAALAVLSAASEVHPNGVEWEPQERVLPIGQESGADRLRWIVLDEAGRPIDHSRNLDDAGLAPVWTANGATGDLPSRLVDRAGHGWRVSQIRIRPIARTESVAAPPDPEGSAPLHPFLILTAFAPLSPLESALSALGGLLAALSVSVWLVAALLCRWISRRALTPLAGMVASAQGLDAAEEGWRLREAGTGDELDDLGRAFNDLLARLQLAYERQRRFGGDAAHQLRTPLTVLIGQIEVALRHDRAGDEYRRVLRSALGRAVQLGQIVEALLFLGRAESDARLPDAEPLDLRDWVNEHIAARSASGGAREIVHDVTEAGPLPVWAHRPLLAQMLDNLLDNATKYGKPGTPIVVETYQEGNDAVLTVQDSGPGISAEDAPHVFKPFYRSAHARKLGTPGVGLGLAVVHRIATAFGGSVQLASTPAKGCRVEVRLPVESDHPEPAPPPSAVRAPECIS